MIYILWYHGESIIAVCSSRESAETMQEEYIGWLKVADRWDEGTPLEYIFFIEELQQDQWREKYVACSNVVLPQRTE